MLGVVRFIDTERRIVVTRVEGKGNRELVFTGCRVSVWDDAKVL